MLLRSWINHAGLGDRTAWVSVERDERDAQRFWLAVIDELARTVSAEACLDNLAPTLHFDGEAVVDRLVAELNSLEQPVVLVIDDLHALRSAEALGQLTDLLSRRPPLLSVVLATRHDPHLGLHRLRLTGELTELRAADLAFTLEDTRALLAASQVAVSDESLALLHTRTEGWAAGLRLAAITLAGHPEPERFVAEFSGAERTVADYLLAEVLDQQSEDVRRLLLRTSVLERVNGALANHLVEGSGSERILHTLEETNAFVVSVDRDRSWFRYHQLFAELLRLELRRTEPGLIAPLHSAAATWHAEHGHVVDAVRHAQAAQDWQYAARLLGEHTISLILDGRWATVGALLAAFPAHATSDPELAPVLVTEQIRTGSFEEAAACLDLGEHRARAVQADRRRIIDVRLAMLRLWVADQRSDFGSVVDEVRTLLAPIAADAPAEVELGDDLRAVALMHLGIVELWSQRPADGETHLLQALQLARRAGRPYLEARCLGYLALPLGNRPLAVTHQQALEAITIADTHGWGADVVITPALLAACGAELWQGRFENMERWLTRAERVVGVEINSATGLLLHLARGMHEDAAGRYGRAIAAFREAKRVEAHLVTQPPLRILVRSHLACTQTRLGDIAGARATLDELTEQEREWGDGRIALAFVHLADGDAIAAADVLGPVLDGSAAVFHVCSLIQALLLDAQARDKLSDPATVETDLERALDLAEPDGIVWPFVLTRSRELLERHLPRRTRHVALLARIHEVLSGSAPQPAGGNGVELPAKLTEGELRVLRYLSSNFSAPEIGAELYLSVNTVKTHMRHIYAKLGVRRRTDAIERAHALGLVPAPTLRRRSSEPMEASRAS